MTKATYTALLASGLSALALMAPASSGAQSAGPSLVIQGATLIDGNGGTPVADSVVVVEGDRIVAAGPRAKVKVSAGAQVIDATGKYLVPGLIDAKSNYASAYGEGYLIWGVTAAVVTGGGSGDAGVAERDAINHGMLAGPRLILSYATLGGPGPDGKKQDGGMPGRNGYIAHSPEEARFIAGEFLSAGADLLSANDGDGTPDIYAAFVEEAHKVGTSAVMRTIGPGTAAREAAMMGADVLIHTGNAGNQIAKDPSKWAKSISFAPDAYADMDDAKASEMIRLLVSKHVALEPDMMAADRGFSRNWARVQREDAGFYADPKVAAYMPKVVITGLLENVKDPATYMDPQALDMRARGFRNHALFLKRFVDAGGRIVAASDIPQTPAGFGVLQEMAVYEEDIGLTPMQALQSATKWAADAFRIKDLGVIAPGKYASMIIVSADPTKTVLNLRKIDTVIKEGKVIDRTYHADYMKKTFMAGMTREGGYSFGSPAVEGTRWAAAVKQATYNPNPPRNAGFGGGSGDFASGLVGTPGIESIFPYTVPLNSPATTFTLRGFNFSPDSIVLIDGHAAPAKVLSRTEIQVTFDHITEPGPHYMQVKNPGALTTPEWGDTSNAAKVVTPYAFTTRFSQNKF
jgi:hypothetical protein